MASDASATAEAVARRSYGRLIAILASRGRDLAAAEDALSEAFARALVEWPRTRAPGNPEAWLMTVARRQLIDGVRRRQTGDAMSDHLRLIADELAAARDDAGGFGDQRLGLMFACAHPAIEEGIRAPLILQSLLGFDAAAIGEAFLVSPAAMGQRLSRAKAKIKDAGIPFRVPDRSELPERLEAVLDAIYAAYAEGWMKSTKSDDARGALAEEAIWLGRLVVSLLPNEPEALALVSLMLHLEARRPARRDAGGDYVPLAEQEVAQWDMHLIGEAEQLLMRASHDGPTGRYQLEAAVQSAHAARRFTGRSDWRAIAQLYDALIVLTHSPVVAINRAVAIAETRGAVEGLATLEAAAGDPRLAEYQPYWAARAELLARAGDRERADQAYERAIGLADDPAVRTFLQKKRSGLSQTSGV
ncbi:MAG: RNA polymerase subunit sigma-70 [Rhizobiales bacterium]|nr:RNA polymerase subunit sigma-70 [Hyphomicrobiales bacterium]